MRVVNDNTSEFAIYLTENKHDKLNDVFHEFNVVFNFLSLCFLHETTVNIANCDQVFVCTFLQR